MSITTEERDEDEVGFDAEMVERRARIFRFGHFPAKNRGLGWTCTRDEFIAFNGESGTVPIGVDPVRRKHYLGEKSVFDGRTGEATFTVEGDCVYATLRTPPMVMDSALEHGLKISSVFRSALDKTLTKVDLVDAPHFDDAVIFEADAVIVFEDEEPEEIEFCKGGSCKHHEAYQTMHDLSSHGRPGLCEPPESRKSGPGRLLTFKDLADARTRKVGFAKEKKETDDDKLLRQMHHHAVHNGAYCPGMPDGIHGEIGMSTEDEEIRDDEGGDEPEQPEPVTFTAEDFRAMQARIRQLEARDVAKDAIAFTKEVTTGKDARATERAQKKAIEEGYLRAARIDAADPEPIAFTDEKGEHKGTHVEAFRALVLGFPKVGIVGAKVSGRPAEVAFTALEMEPDEGAEHQQKEAERREKQRAETKAWVLAEQGRNGAN